jgi:tetratricopeptide (TPR) repeat protein
MALTGRTFIFRIAAAVLLLHVSVSAAAAQAGRPAGTSRHSVTISTEPGAKIWVDGVLYGTASKSGTLKLTNLTPTRKTIRVRADGFKELQKAVVPTQAEQISLSLTKTTDEAELAFQEAERFATVDRAKAVQAYQRALKLRPGYAEAHIGLARLYTETGEVDKAEKAITAARRAKPGLAEVSAIEGRIFKGVDEEAKAIASFKRAIREGSGFQPEAYAGLGILYKEKAEGFGAAGDYDREAANYAESAKHLSTAIKQLGGAPDAVVLYQFLGLVYEQQKKPEKAIAVYEEFLKAFPDHPESAAFESFIVQLKKEAARQN